MRGFEDSSEKHLNDQRVTGQRVTSGFGIFLEPSHFAGSRFRKSMLRGGTDPLDPPTLRPPTVSQGDTSHHLYSVESGAGHSDIFIDGVSYNDTRVQVKHILSSLDPAANGIPLAENSHCGAGLEPLNPRTLLFA
jgi:hypothetical protein